MKKKGSNQSEIILEILGQNVRNNTRKKTSLAGRSWAFLVSTRLKSRPVLPTLFTFAAK